MSMDNSQRRVLVDGQIVDDTWSYVDDASTVPPDGNVVVTWQRWCDERAPLESRESAVGVLVPNTMATSEFAESVLERPLVVLEFPKFSDGRAYSQARQLRDTYRFAGELRAFGDVLRDQIFYMHRCGFNAYDPRTRYSLEDLVAGLNDFSVTYQAASDDPRPIYRRT